MTRAGDTEPTLLDWILDARTYGMKIHFTKVMACKIF